MSIVCMAPIHGKSVFSEIITKIEANPTVLVQADAQFLYSKDRCKPRLERGITPQIIVLIKSENWYVLRELEYCQNFTDLSDESKTYSRLITKQLHIHGYSLLCLNQYRVSGAEGATDSTCVRVWGGGRGNRLRKG